MLAYLTRNQGYSKKILILFANMVFYLWGGIGTFIFGCVFSAVVWLFSILVSRLRGKASFLFGIIICITLIPLLAVKYTGFAIENINDVLGYEMNIPALIVPVGISFYTFEAVSLLCDIRTGKIKEKVSLLDVYLYLMFFPTVTSGPIFRFENFRNGLNGELNLSNYGNAIDRIIIGLSKKVLVADKIAILADYYFDGVASGNEYSCLGLWIGSFAYTLQLYFDFSGYSDMAIGMGKLLGFDICENFNNPYQANSISDFWKRWHISLSQWFRDYVYIPLGGNRCAKWRHVFNLFMVWVLTGIWHGADWSFVLWGLGYFVLLVLEKYVPAMKKIGNHWYGHIYALFFINLLWIPFRADDLSVTLKYVSGMFGVNGVGALESKAIAFLFYLAVAACLCLPWKRWLERYNQNKCYKILKGLMIIVLAFMAVCAVINSSYAPYIYGNF